MGEKVIMQDPNALTEAQIKTLQTQAIQESKELGGELQLITQYVEEAISKSMVSLQKCQSRFYSNIVLL